MKMPERKFEDAPAERKGGVPLLVGMTGPSGGGKTFSALRVATGIQQVVGGDIFFIDTESRRALHYADMFRFRHVPFSAPFGSLDYLAALEYCVKRGAGVIVIDSMSHEHEGPGGMLDLHEKILDDKAGDDWGKRERMKMLAWQEPKARRRRLINGILQINAQFVFCFRAKDTAKPVKNPQTGKNEVMSMGYMPIAGEEFVFEMTVNFLLLPAAKGRPTWQSDMLGERSMMKLPEQFIPLFRDIRPLDEDHGRAMALWARGEGPAAKPRQQAPQHQAAVDAAPAAAGGPVPPTDQALFDAILPAARLGMDALQADFKLLPNAHRVILKPRLEELKTIAAKADAAKAIMDPNMERADELIDAIGKIARYEDIKGWRDQHWQEIQGLALDGGRVRDALARRADELETA